MRSTTWKASPCARAPDGEILITMISDDNFNSFLQRTVLLEFALPPSRRAPSKRSTAPADAVPADPIAHDDRRAKTVTRLTGEV